MDNTVVHASSVPIKRLVRKTAIGPRRVFDLEVRDVHNYYASGVNVHNCDYHEMLKDHAQKTGEELFTFTTTQLYYKHRALMIYPSGPNRKTLRGKTRFFAATDEFDFFDGSEESDAIKMNGKEVRTSLNNSLANVRIAWRSALKRDLPNTPGGYGMYVSSPDHAMGVLTQLVQKKENSSSILALNLATWEIHPKLTRKAIIRAFDPDPMRLDRDFGAQPPLNSNPFMTDPETVAAMAQEDRPNRVVLSTLSEMVKERLRIKPKIEKLIAPQRIRPTILALDAGFSNNSFSLAVLGAPLNDKGAEKLTVHALAEITPGRKEGTIDFHSVYENVIVPVIQQLNVQVMLADRWNSLKLLHDAAAEHGIFVDQYSLRYPDFCMVRSYMEAGAIALPRFTMKEAERLSPDLTKYPQCFKGHPVDHFYFQAITVRDLGKTVDKGMGLTDDIWRAVVLGARFALDEEFAKKYLKGVLARRALGGIAAGSYMAQVQSFGNSNIRDARGHIESSVVAASGGVPGINANTFGVTSGVFARKPV